MIPLQILKFWFQNLQKVSGIWRFIERLSQSNTMQSYAPQICIRKTMR